MEPFDAIVVGASVAGSTAAALLAEHGATVALIEKAPDPEHYKKLCTHELMGSANEPLERLGLLDEIERLTGNHEPNAFWTRYGWIKVDPRDHDRIAWTHNVRRQTLDPMLRHRAMDADGVDGMLGWTVTELLREDGRPAGVIARDKAGDQREIRGKIVIGADGRSSGLARLAGIPARVRPHGRFGYAAYFKGVKGTSGGAQMWLSDPEVAYRFPTDGDLTMLAYVAPHDPDRIAAFKQDFDGELVRVFEALEDGPDMSNAERVDVYRGALKVDNQWRAAAAPGVALVGDAAQVSDYVWGTGCAFAMRTAMWLADEVGPVLAATGSRTHIDAALERYRKRHRRELSGHHLLATDYSSGRPFTVVDRMLYKAAANDRKTAKLIYDVGAREEPLDRLLTPRAMARAARVALTT